MTLPIETQRLLLRKITPDDLYDMYKLDSDPRVHQYLEPNGLNRSIADARKSIDYIISQYNDLGIGRWAVIEKSSGKFIGWTGLKLTNFYDIGYRLIPDYWGRGYATESALPAMEYGFRELKIETLYGITHADNQASHKVLLKLGLKHKEDFYYRPASLNLRWYEINKEEYEKRMP